MRGCGGGIDVLIVMGYIVKICACAIAGTLLIGMTVIVMVLLPGILLDRLEQRTQSKRGRQ